MSLPPADTLAIKITGGKPTDDEVAAVVTTLAIMRAGTQPDDGECAKRSSGWSGYWRSAASRRSDRTRASLL